MKADTSAATEVLQERIVDAVRALLRSSGSSSLCFDIGQASDATFVAVGSIHQIRLLLQGAEVAQQTIEPPQGEGANGKALP